MANTWTVNADGSVDLNGVLIANPFNVHLDVVWNSELAILETQLTVEVPNGPEISAIDAVLAVLPGSPTYAEIHGYEPRTTYSSHVGDTINVAALSLVQQTTRPDKQGV